MRGPGHKQGAPTLGGREPVGLCTAVLDPELQVSELRGLPGGIHEERRDQTAHCPDGSCIMVTAKGGAARQRHLLRKQHATALLLGCLLGLA